MSSDQRGRMGRRECGKASLSSLHQRSMFAEGMAEDCYETVTLRSRPAQTDPELQLDGVDLFLHRKRRQSTNRRRRVLSEASAEHLHKVVFIGGRVAPAERHIDSLGQRGRAERQNNVSKERCTQRGSSYLTGGNDLVASLLESHPQIANWLDHVPPMNEKHPD